MSINNKEYFESMCVNKDNLRKLKLYKNISIFFNDITNNCSSKIAIEWKNDKKTFKELREDVSKVRTLLIKKGLKKNDNIGLAFKNEYDFVVFFFASLTLGLVAVCLPISIPLIAIYKLSNKFDCKCVFLSNSLSKQFNEFETLNPNIFNLVDNYKQYDQSENFDLDIDENSPACIVLTGGSTGNPKGAVLSHRNLCRGAINGCYMPIKMFNLKYVSLIPFTHIFGLVKNLLSCFLSESTLYIVSNPLNFISEMSTANPDVLVLTPGLVKIVLTVLEKFPRNILGNKLSIIIAGGADVPSYLIEELYKYGINCYPGYGSTESTNLVTGNATIPSKASSVGIPYYGEEIIIKDGEVLVKGDNVFLGYYKDVEETNKVLKNGYLYTGDLGYFDDEGYLYITGRKTNLIVLQSGLKISPEEIENKINKCPYVVDSIVFSSTINNIQTINAEIYVKEENRTNDNVKKIENYINTNVNNSLSEFEKIRNIIFRDNDFKRSPAMKIIREHK